MATQGKAARSASGAAMSKYDVEVEARLKALEAKVASLESSDKAQQELEACSDFKAVEDGEAEGIPLEDLMAAYNQVHGTHF